MGGGFWTSPVTQTVLGSLGGLRVGPYSMVARGGGFRPFLPAYLYAGHKSAEEMFKGLEEYIPPGTLSALKRHAFATGELPSLGTILPLITVGQTAKVYEKMMPLLFKPPEVQLTEEVPQKEITPYEEIMKWEPELTPQIETKASQPTLTPPREPRKVKLDIQKFNLAPSVNFIDMNEWLKLIKENPHAAGAIFELAKMEHDKSVIWSMAQNTNLDEENLKMISFLLNTGDTEGAKKHFMDATQNKQIGGFINEISKSYAEKGGVTPEIIASAAELGISLQAFNNIDNLLSKSYALRFVNEPEKVKEIADLAVNRLKLLLKGDNKTVLKVLGDFGIKDKNKWLEELRQNLIGHLQNIALITKNPKELFNYADTYINSFGGVVIKALQDAFYLKKALAVSGGRGTGGIGLKDITQRLKELSRDKEYFERKLFDAKRTGDVAAIDECLRQIRKKEAHMAEIINPLPPDIREQLIMEYLPKGLPQTPTPQPQTPTTQPQTGNFLLDLYNKFFDVKK